MASNREKRQQEVNFWVMQLLQEDPSISTREIAHRVGISNGTAYYCLTALIDRGFVKLKNFTQSRTKSNYLYEFTPRGIRIKAGLTLQFLERKKKEYNDLKAEILNHERKLGLDQQETSTDKTRIS